MKYWTTIEAARRWGLHPESVRRAIRRGDVPGVRRVDTGNPNQRGYRIPENAPPPAKIESRGKLGADIRLVIAIRLMVGERAGNLAREYGVTDKAVYGARVWVMKCVEEALR